MPPKKFVNNTSVKKTSADGVKSIEEKYRSMTQEQHILARPDTYIGDILTQNEPMYIYCDRTNKILKKNITYVPGLYKIFDEIVVNARDQTEVDNSCDTIMVDVNKETGEISVYNNGRGIDVEIHEEHKIYVPELIFAKLLTSTNYDDDEQRTTGGRNGYGAKLTNLFSSKFVVEVVDFARKRKYTQEFTDNMANKSKPIIENLKLCKNGSTKITFIPDFSKFKINGLTDDIVALFKKRIYDLAGVTNKCKIYYNGKKIECKDFEQYIKLYHFEGMPEEDDEEENNEDNNSVNDGIEEDQSYKLFFDKVSDKWEVGFMYAPDCGKEQVSFVNGICTYHGGTHVSYVTDIVVDKLKEMVLKKHKDITIKPNQIKDNLIVFVKAVIINPSFTSQTKETLKTKVSEFGSKCEIKDKILTRFAKSGILNQVVTMIKLKEQAVLKKTDGKKVTRLSGIPKLEDANKAGGKESHKCKLILTEGDSAKALAMAGRSVVGSDYYGIFPLKGKLLNVREASAKQLLENEEIINIKKIMGLKHEEVYNDLSGLRYGGIILMTDQDHDGFHIKGLLLNFIHYFWPSLLKINDFVTCLSTPIVKATKGKEVIEFYNLNDYETWRNQNLKGWTIKYYKGLGTSTSKEAKEYFTDIDSKLINYLDDKVLLKEVFLVDQESGSEEDVDNDEENDENIIDVKTNEDGDNIITINTHIKPKYTDPCTEVITLAFEKKRADDRKKWLGSFDSKIILENSQKKVPVGDFINKELIQFSNEDNNRSIPSVFDGLKPSQRKVLFGTVSKKLNDKSNEIRVAQLAGYISEKTCYHHGEASLNGTIIGMAQNYVGSNNINILYPSGQFGTRVKGGKDAASPRYIHTYLAELTKLIFRPDDEPILNYLDDDGVSIEPEFYMPIIPMVLVNGTEGIGTGFSTKIPCFNPLTIIDNIVAMIEDKPIKSMIPWYKNFTGTVLQVPDKPTHFVTCGVVNKIDDKHVRISELPIGTWTADYRETLDKLESKNVIKSYTANNTDDIINILVEIDEDKLSDMITKKTLHGSLNLITKKSITNMHLYDETGKIKKYFSPIEILEDFYNVRIEYYEKRKSYIINKLTRELNLLTWKMKFINDVLNKNIIIERRKKQEIIDRLTELKYPQLANDDKNISYDYLILMPIYSLSEEKIKELEDKCKNKQEELAKVIDTTCENMWMSEINELRDAYIKWSNDNKIVEEVVKTNSKSTVKKTTSKTTMSKTKTTASKKSNSVEI
jgi:DNA topoisomerase-2